MEKVPATVFVFNPGDTAPWGDKPVLRRVGMLVDTQSVGAAIQNMLLRAQEPGVGSLWICDTFYAHGQVCAWLGQRGLLVAAVSRGYPDEAPAARPRKALEALVTWRE